MDYVQDVSKFPFNAKILGIICNVYLSPQYEYIIRKCVILLKRFTMMSCKSV